MSGFSAEWLALREPVDHRSRNQGLQADVLDYLAQIKPVQAGSIRIVDLGSGTGSNLRALAPHLNAFQHWTLVDHDPALLQAARIALLAWADDVANSDANQTMSTGIAPVEPITITKNSKAMTIEFRCADLVNDYQAILSEPADLITAAAFFDLVAESWLAQFCAALSKPLYTVLTYDGIEKWSPPEPIDADILAAFHQHQRTNKGFGAAVGPTAPERLESLLRAQNFITACAPSPWVLDHHDRSLIAQLAKGSANAVRETRILQRDDVDRWEQLRRGATHCEIGHVDFFAYKP
jgi:SAM-dependent methyltransferase